MSIDISSLETHQPRTRNVIKAISTLLTLLIILVAYSQPRLFSDYLAIPITIALITFLGIPHGAIDHIIYYQICRQNPSSRVNAQGSDRSIEIGKRLGFYWNYLLIMKVWAFSWYFCPTVTLVVFLAISAYHFGEVCHDEADLHLIYLTLGRVT